jgi:antagonist of KipI
LKFNKHINGCRCYLAVHGGWEAELWLSSYSTNLKASAGGYKGRALRRDDLIEIKNSKIILPAMQNAGAEVLNVTADLSKRYTETKKIRCVAGNETTAWTLIQNDISIFLFCHHIAKVIAWVTGCREK